MVNWEVWEHQEKPIGDRQRYFGNSHLVLVWLQLNSGRVNTLHSGRFRFKLPSWGKGLPHIPRGFGGQGSARDLQPFLVSATR
jgi:hypothetical protein